MLLFILIGGAIGAAFGDVGGVALGVVLGYAIGHWMNRVLLPRWPGMIQSQLLESTFSVMRPQNPGHPRSAGRKKLRGDSETP